MIKQTGETIVRDEWDNLEFNQPCCHQRQAGKQLIRFFYT